MTSLHRKMANGAAWTIAMRFSERLLGLVSTVILARLLTPEHFGLIAMGTALMAALEAFTMFGFETALIQRQTKEPTFLNTAWTLNLILGAGNGLILLAAAPAAAWFYGEHRVVEILGVLALAALLGGARNIGMVLYEQDIQFARLVSLILIKKITAIVVTISIAFMVHDYRALLAGIIAGALTDTFVSYFLSPYRPRLCLLHWHDLVKFSRWLLINNILHFLGARGADFIVGRMAGASALGAFNISYELANLPTTELVFPISRAVFPGYAQLANNQGDLREAFITVFGVIALVALPAAIGIACLAQPFVAVLLGKKWLVTVPLIEALALFGATRVMQANTGSVYLALGKPYIMTGLAGFFVVTVLTTFGVTLAYYDLKHAVWAFFVAGAAVGIINLATLAFLLRLSMLEMLRPLLRPTLAVSVMAFTLLWGTSQVPAWLASDHQWAVLFGGILVGATVYTATLWSCWKIAGTPTGPEEKLMRLVTQLLKRRAAAEPGGSA